MREACEQTGAEGLQTLGELLLCAFASAQFSALDLSRVEVSRQDSGAFGHTQAGSVRATVAQRSGLSSPQGTTQVINVAVPPMGTTSQTPTDAGKSIVSPCNSVCE